MKTATSLLIALAVAGCGSAAGPGYDPPIFTVDGVIRSSSVATPPRIHVSLLWERVQFSAATKTSIGATVGYVAEDVTIAAQFPAQFQLSTSRTPPPEAFAAGDGLELPFVIGYIVAWADGNGNGTLDPVPGDGTTSPDTILGTSASYVWYANTSMPIADQTFAIQPGFNLVGSTGAQYPAGCDTYASCTAGEKSGTHTLPAGATIELALTGATDFTDELLCGFVIPPTDPTQLNNPPTTDDCVVPQAPPGGSVHFSCYPGTRLYAAYVCATDEGMCWSRCPLTYHGCPASMPLPADWPCAS